MSFKELLIKKLKKDNYEFSEEFLPNGYQKIGDIIILNLNPELTEPEKKIIAQAVLDLFRVRSVCNKEGEISGQLRLPNLKVIAGDENTSVCHFENNCYFCFDIKKAMFAKGNVAERGRLPQQVGSEEMVVDMFAGIGYFTIPIAKLAKPKKIYAIELNPDSVGFLKQSLVKNKIKSDAVEVIQGNSNEVVVDLMRRGIRADRVLMGYLPPPKEFIDAALSIVKKGGMIHYDDLILVDKEYESVAETVKLFNKHAKKFKLRVEIVHAQKVKSYKPRVDHYVLDLKVSGF